MEIAKRLQEIWNENYIDSLPKLIKERGYMFAENFQEKDILITGFNPSFRESDSLNFTSYKFENILNDEKWDNYWGNLKKLLYSDEENIDLRKKSAYLDLFYFREQEQSFLRNEILKTKGGVSFVVDQINLTQHIIEDVIKPKLIIIKNKESVAYFGKMANEGIIWMGYEFEFIENIFCGELYKITGLINSTERIAPELSQTNLVNTLVLFTQHINQYMPKEKRPTPIAISTLLDYCYAFDKIKQMKI